MENSEMLSWSILEYKEKDHTVDWYWTVGLVTLVAVAVSFYFRDYLFGILLAISIGTLVYLTFRKPKEVSVSITNKGIVISNELFKYKTLKSFWVESEVPSGHEQHLLVMTDRLYSPMIAVPIGDVAPELIREILSEYIEEKEMQENLSHRFIEMLGF
jgi:hypothetical protein